MAFTRRPKRWSPNFGVAWKVYGSVLSRGRIQFFLLAIVAGAFLWGLYELFAIRLTTGSVYPAYSTFRNDPLGTKALYASLERTSGISAARIDSPLTNPEDGPAAKTLFLIGVNTQQPDVAPESMVKTLDQVAESGGRVIIVFAADADDFALREEMARMQQDEDREPENEEQESPYDEMVELIDAWKVRLEYEGLGYDIGGKPRTAMAIRATDDPIPGGFTWHSGLYFRPSDDEWRTLYTCLDRPVIIEREIGRGTQVLVGDPYLLTNEALAADREPELLAWLVGTNAHIVFDERHLGMQRNPGTMFLIRRYGLESVIAGAILLAMLFAWRAGTSLAPRYADSLPADAGRLESGRDAHAGFTNLVRRSTPKQAVAGVCVDTWKHASPTAWQRLQPADREELERRIAAALNAHASDSPEMAYRAVHEILEERKLHLAHDR